MGDEEGYYVGHLLGSTDGHTRQGEQTSGGQMNTEPQGEFMTPKDVAKYFGVSVWTVLRLDSNLGLTRVRTGTRSVFYRRKQVYELYPHGSVGLEHLRD